MIRRAVRRVRARVALEALTIFYTVGLIALVPNRLAGRLWWDWWSTVRPEVVRLADRRMLNERRA